MNEAEIKKFVPIAGMVVYKRDKDYYLQSHEILRSGNNFTWGAGQSFQKDHLSELISSIKKQNFTQVKLKGLLPENVIFFQPGTTGVKIIFYTPPKLYDLAFQNLIKDGKYFMPGFIFAVSDKNLYVFSYKGKDRPNEKTELFHAPLFNISSNGLVCMGTVSESRPKKFLDEEVDRWLRRFFGGVFTSAHWSDNRLKKGTLEELLISVHQKQMFPERLMVKHKHETLQLFLKSFIDNNKKVDHEDED
jgi:PRTRC genetic system protein B